MASADERSLPLVIAPSRLKGRGAVVVLALIIAAGLVVFAISDSLTERVVSACMVVATGLVLRAIGRRFWNGEPLLVVRDDGLEHPRLGQIGWDDVRALTITHGNQGRALKISVRGSRRRITLHQILLPMSCEALRAAIELRAKRKWPR